MTKDTRRPLESVVSIEAGFAACERATIVAEWTEKVCQSWPPMPSEEVRQGCWAAGLAWLGVDRKACASISADWGNVCNESSGRGQAPGNAPHAHTHRE